jgi:acyl-homoserine-lactone acylase
VVLPVDASDALMHLHRITYSFFLANRNQARGWERGSNAWAIAPKRSASGRAMLLANPHLPWSDVFTWFEAHLNAPGIRAYGAALVGMPVLPIAFNERLGWTHTVNTQDGNDVYELTLQERGYRWDGGVRSFEQESRTLRVREKNGAFRDETLIVRRSVHGPVIGEKPGKALALRVVGFDHGFAFEQWWDMARARSLAEFETAISRMQVSGQNITYADADGRILYHYGGNTPVRSRADRGFWQRVVPGDTSATLWTALHGYADMPRVVDPPSGWVQNANDPPWHATVPPGMSPSQYPAYLAPVTLSSRPQQSIRLLMADSSITFDELVEYKHSTRMGHADRVLEPLLAAARGSTDSLIGAAAQILAGWDRAADAESRGAVLFQEWWYEYADRLRGRSLFAEPWNPQRPLDTPSGLGRPDTAVAALAAAAERVRARHGRLDVSWGAVHRVRRDGLDFPGNGGPGDLGVFRVVGYDSTSQGRIAESGDSYVVVIEFGDPVRAMALVGYGNWSQPNTPHRTDQLALFAEKRLRSVWLDRASVERNLERREWVTIPESAAGGRR